jgi:hypothetical protein
MTAPTEVMDAACRSRAWITGLLDDIEDRGRPSARPLCHMLVACWTAGAITGTGSWFPAMSRRVAGLLHRLEQDGQENLLVSAAVSPTTKLLVEVLLSANGAKVASLRAFLDATVAILSRAEPIVDDAGLLDKRVVLSAAGLLPHPSPTSADALRGSLEGVRLSAQPAVVERIAFHLEGVTLWGMRRLPPKLSTGLLHDVFSGLVVDALRRYDLHSAARLLRLTGYVTPDRIRRPDLHEFLLGQQDASGAFGRFGPEAADLRQQRPDADPELELNLPTTVEVLRTMAEAHVPGWRLLSDVPPHPGALAGGGARRRERVPAP